MQRTPNLGLPQFEPSDKYRLEDYNEAYTKIDEKIKELDDKEAQLDTKLAETKEELTNLENAKGTIDSNLNVYGDIKLFNTERVSNSEGDTILSSSESGKFIYFRPGGVNNANGQVVLKENEFVVENGLVISGNVALNSGKTLHVGNTEYYEGAINNWAKNDNFVLHLNNGKCFVPSDGINRNNALGHPKQPWQDLYLGSPSISTNGFTKLPNGLILQWGIVEVRNTDYDINVAYPISFPNMCLSVWFSDVMNVVDDKREYCNFKTWNTSQLDKFSFRGTGFSNWVYPRWYALGY